MLGWLPLVKIQIQFPNILFLYQLIWQILPVLYAFYYKSKIIMDNLYVALFCSFREARHCPWRK